MNSVPKKLSASWSYRNGDSGVDLQMAEHPLDAVALGVVALAERCGWIGRDDGSIPHSHE